MITIGREGAKVQLQFRSPSLQDKDHYFAFTFDCGEEWIARALEQIVRNELSVHMKEIRQEMYEEGLKAAKVKKADRRDWFAPWC